MPPWDLEATSPLKSRPSAKHGFLSSSQQAWGLAWAFHPRPWLSLRATVCSAARNPELTTGRGPAPAGQGRTLQPALEIPAIHGATRLQSQCCACPAPVSQCWRGEGCFLLPQADLKLLGSHGPPTLASQIAGTLVGGIPVPAGARLSQ